MHIVNLLEHLLPELIPFILKNLSNQDLINCRSINDIWAKEVDLEWPKRKTLFDFRTGSLIQGNYMVKEFYSKLKECSVCIGYPEWLLKNLFLRELSPENTFKVLLGELEVLALDKIVKRLSLEQ